ncbi:hypothetical protein GCM10009558_075360 [Virgisporangium aurantiacum]
MRSLLSRLLRTGLLLVLLGGVPYGLLTQLGSPLPDQLPDVDQIGQALVEPASDDMVLAVLAGALWIVWAAFAVSVAVEIVAAVRGVPVPRLRPIAPMQTFVGWLIAGLLIAAPLLTVATQTTPAPRVTATAHHGQEQPDLTPTAVTATVQQPTYQVAKGDWLGRVAERFLGDFDRYPEIQDLNTGLIPHDTGPDGPDHIEPGWRLVLPADAHDRGPQRHATGQLLVPPAQPSPAEPPNTDAPSTPTDPDPDGVVPDPTAPGATAPAGSATPSRAPSSPAEEAPVADTGVDIPGGWLTLPLAAAVVAAAALVWRRRRHRYRHRPLETDDPDDPDLHPLPPAVGRLRNAVRTRSPELLDPPAPAQPSVTEYAGDDPPDLPPPGPSGPQLAGIDSPVPAGGLGLDGPGAGAPPAAPTTPTPAARSSSPPMPSPPSSAPRPSTSARSRGCTSPQACPMP